MSPVAVDSPLRRSEVFRTPRTVVVNDDDAERRSRRFEASLDQSVAGQNIQIEDNETIKMCLQLYSDNKLNKDNAWNLTIIDTFSKLMSKHSKGLENFQAAGSTLEASAKVYGLRVDSVHTDVMRMCSELTRQSARAMDNNRNEGDLDDSADAGNQENIDPNGTVAPSQPGAEADRNKKKKRKRQMVSTVTKNRDTINQKLDTNPFTDPFFAKLNSVVGDVNSSNRLMQNIVPTSQSELRLRMNYRLWDDSDVINVAIEEGFGPDSAEITSINSQNLLPNMQLHNLLYGYVISDTPAEDEEEDVHNDLTRQDTMLHDLGNASEVALNRSALDVQFDVNAEVDPIPPVGDAHIMEFDQGDDAEDYNEEDHFALNQCRGLRRSTNMIEDLRPVDVTLLEYSYRPLDMISQYWAGPSHWKFKRTKPKSSMSLRFSAAGPDGSQQPGPSSAPQRQTQKTKKKKKNFEAGTLDETISLNEELFVGFSMSKPLKNITYLKSTLCKKWDAKKLRLPTDLKLDRHRFDVYRFAQGLKVHESDSQTEPDIPVGDYNYNNVADQEYCARPSKDNCDEGDYADNIFNNQDGPDFDDGGGGGEDTMNIPGGDMPVNHTVDFISSNYEGAPDKVAKIHIPYAKTAKVVDMKQMKSCCWRLIESKNTETPDKAINPTFKYIYDELPHVLTKPMSDNVSLSLAFYSVLHLANEKSLKLSGQPDLEDFAIITPDRQ